MLPWNVDAVIRGHSRYPMGQAFIESLLAPYDTSLLRFIEVRHDTSLGYAATGMCRYPRGLQGYRMMCTIGGFYPHSMRAHQNAIEPPPRTPPSELRAVVTLLDEIDGMVWMLSHEISHMLRHGKQLAGRNSEWAADTHAKDALWRFQAQHFCKPPPTSATQRIGVSLIDILTP